MKLVFNLSSAVLSPQILIDCDMFESGCIGGSVFQALYFNGIQTEADYPYTGEVGRCRFNSSKSVLPYTDTPTVYLTDESNGEAGLQDLVAKKGPVAALVDASSDSFKEYKSGVYYNPDCKKKEKDLHHAVLVVGYGTDPKEGDYWLVVSVIPGFNNSIPSSSFS